MNGSMKIIVGIVVVSLALFMFKNKIGSLDPIAFNGEIYSHVDASKVNNVVNHFLTPGGLSLSSSTNFLQITDARHPDLSDRHVDMVRKQLMQTMYLKPVEGRSGRYFGMFGNGHPIYGLEKDKVFVIHYVTEGFSGDKNALRAGANTVIDAMDKILIPM